MTDEEMREKLTEMQRLQAEMDTEYAKAQHEVGEVCQTIAATQAELLRAIGQIRGIAEARGYHSSHEELVFSALITQGQAIERLAKLIATPVKD